MAAPDPKLEVLVNLPKGFLKIVDRLLSLARAATDVFELDQVPTRAPHRPAFGEVFQFHSNLHPALRTRLLAHVKVHHDDHLSLALMQARCLRSALLPWCPAALTLLGQYRPSAFSKETIRLP